MIHYGARLLGWTAEGLSLITAGVVMIQATPVTTTSNADETVAWMLRGLLAVSLALNTYFLKRLSDSVSKCADKSGEHETRITVLERSYEAWLAAQREDFEGFDRRERSPGRRTADFLARAKKGNTDD